MQEESSEKTVAESAVTAPSTTVEERLAKERMDKKLAVSIRHALRCIFL